MKGKQNIKHWVSGIMLWGWPTKAKNGQIAGWDADFGEMCAWNGKLVPEDEFKKLSKINKQKYVLTKQRTANEYDSRNLHS